jgi:hypothetical protein
MMMLTARLHVHHQVLEHLADAHHGNGGNHVQDQLLSGARLEPGGAGEDFGPHDDFDGNVCNRTDGRVFIAGYGGGGAAHFPGVFQGSQDVRGAAAGGNPDHHVPGLEADVLQVLGAHGVVVFGPFHSLGKGHGPAGQQGHHLFRGSPEGGRALGGVQKAQPTAGSGPHIDQAAAGFKGPDHSLNGLLDLRDGLANGRGHLGIFLVHGLEGFQGRHEVQILGPFIALFR